MSLVDVRALPEATRLAAADRIRTATDFALPDLDWFNNQPCANHTSVAAGMAELPPCRRCGIRFRKHQKVGIAWLYMRGRGLIADQVGTGKTAQAAGLLACCKQTGELDTRRAVIVVRPSVLDQWMTELPRFLPRLAITAAVGPRPKRIATYLGDWHVLVTGFQIFSRDVDLVDNLPVGIIVADDIDPLRNPATQTSYAFKRIARRCARTVILTGTPIQKRLEELHSITEPLGGLEIFGSENTFRRNYIREEMVREYSPSAGRMMATRRRTGYRNLDDFVTKFSPMVLRRTPADIDDVELPAVIPNTIRLDLHPAQSRRYDELRAGVVRLIKEHGVEVKRAEAAAKFVYGQQICAGLVALGESDLPGTSVKLDWVEQVIVDGDLSDEPKIVVFSHFVKTAKALIDRLTMAGIGAGLISGDDTRRHARTATIRRFWDDPACRVLVGTDAIEQGLNLQIARVLINVDQIMNPARMQQLAGRIRRDGSAHRSVYIHNLLTNDTQEESYMDILSREQALADHVWGETNDLFEALSPLAMLELIGSSGRNRR